jgi:hypothetical protein
VEVKQIPEAREEGNKEQQQKTLKIPEKNQASRRIPIIHLRHKQAIIT